MKIVINSTTPPDSASIAHELKAAGIGQGFVMDLLGVSPQTAKKIVEGNVTMRFEWAIKLIEAIGDVNDLVEIDTSHFGDGGESGSTSAQS